MATMHQSSIKQANDLINSINQMKFASTLPSSFQSQKQSQISQYHNLDNKSFSSPQHSKTLLDSFKKNQRSFPIFSTQRQTSPTPDQLLNTRKQNFKESLAQQSLQKAFTLNRNSQRIPFKKKQYNFVDLNYPQGEKRSYNYCEPQYADYYVKGDKHFWTQMFQKFHEKKGSLQNIDFPSFNQKDQSKFSQRFSQLNKQSQIQEKGKNSKAYQKYANKTVIVYAFIAVIVFLIGLKIVSPK